MKSIRILLVLAAAALTAAAGAGCTARAKKAYHLERADRWFQSGQFDKAEIEYLNAFRLDPQNARACCQLGIIYYDEGRFQKAAPYLYRGSRLDATNLDVRLKLGEIYLAIGNLKDAHDQAEYVLERNSLDPAAPVLFAQSVQSTKDIPTARRRLEALASTGDDAALETAQGTLALRERDYKTARADLRRALGMDSHFAAAYVALGNAYQEQNEPRQAEAAFKAGADCAPADSPLQVKYAQFELQTGQFSAAEHSFSSLTKKNPEYVPAWLGLAEVALDEKKLDDCATALTKILDRDPDNVDAQVLDARLDLARSDTAKAVSALERLARLYPQAPRIHYQLALAYLAGQQSPNALQQLHQAVDLDPNFVDASFLLAQLDLKTGDFDSALPLLQNVVARDPSLVQAKLLIADDYRLKGDYQDAQNIFQTLEKAFPRDPELPLLSGSTYVQQQNEDAARREFNRALQIDPSNVIAQEELAQLDMADHDLAGAQKRIEQVVQKNPRIASPDILLAKIFLEQGQTNQAEAALSKAAALPGGASANFLLAQLYFNSKQDSLALQLVNAALAKDPNDPSLLLFAGVIQSDQNNYQAAADSYEKLLANNPRNSAALNNLAWLYCDHLGNLDKAYDLAQRARQLLPTDPSTADTLGWVLFRKGQYDSALKLFQESSAGLPENPEVQFHLGMANYMLDNETAARTALQGILDSGKSFPERNQCADCVNILNIDPKSADSETRAWLEQRFAAQPDDPVAFSRLAAIDQRDHDSGKTAALCQAALRANPQNVPAMILLAQLCSANDPQKGYSLAKRAYQLNPDNPEVCAVLGRLASQNGNDQWAFSLLENASQDDPDNAQTAFDLANAAFGLGKISEAQSDMQNALQIGLPAPAAAAATNFLDMVAICQDPSKVADGAGEIQTILNSNPDFPPALFADALNESRNGDPVGAERDYEKLLARHPDCAPAQKNLAILYAQNFVDPAKAYPVALEAREAYPDNPDVARALALILFQRGEYERAAGLFSSIADSSAADARLFYCLGISEFHLKNYVQSKTSLQHALTLNLSGEEAADARETLAELK